MSWLSRMAAVLAVAVAATLPAGCGFQPMYARAPATAAGGDVVSSLDSVAVEAVRAVESRNARLAQVLRNELLDRVSPHGMPAAPRYRLEVVLRAETTDLLVRRDSTVSRARINLFANYSLYEGDVPVDSGTARAMTGFDLPPEGYFASVISSRDAEQQGAVLISEQITAALSAYFARRTGRPGP